MFYIYDSQKKIRETYHFIFINYSTANFIKHALSVVKPLHMYVCEIESMQLNWHIF